MRRREVITLLGGAAASSLVWPRAARAQQRKTWRIGYPQQISLSAAPSRFEAFREGLKERGYVDGDNIVIDRRAPGSKDNLIALCQEMIAQGADVIVANSTNVALAAQQATKTVPIVMRVAADPVAIGLVTSLARPGGNITGLTSQAADLSAKRLQVFKQLVPRLHRIAVLWEAQAAASPASMHETRAAAHELGIEFESFDVNRADDLAGAFQSIRAGYFDGLDVLASPVLTGNRTRIIAFCSEARMPCLHQERPFVEAGGLVSYGPNFERLFYRMAYYVDRILKGEKPADLPVEQPTTFSLVINLKTAKALGLEVPQTLLATADEVIE
jgi:putative ABC transport system substrate-binding protein